MGDKKEKTYRAIRHDIVRLKQKENCDTVHHPDEKIELIQNVLQGKANLRILELFGGEGNCTSFYEQYGEVITYEKNKEKFNTLQHNVGRDTICCNGDSYREYHNLIYKKQKFDVIDIDPYGFPNRFFPDIFLLIDKGFMFITMPKPFVNILNGITQAHLIAYYGEHNPSFEMIVERIALWGLCHWRKVSMIDYIDCKSIWRICFEVEKVKATEYTGVRNR